MNEAKGAPEFMVRATTKRTQELSLQQIHELIAALRILSLRFAQIFCFVPRLTSNSGFPHADTLDEMAICIALMLKW